MSNIKSGINIFDSTSITIGNGTSTDGYIYINNSSPAPYLRHDTSGWVFSNDGVSETSVGTGFTSYTVGDILYANSINSLSKLSVSDDGYVLTLYGGIPSWQEATSGTNNHNLLINLQGGQADGYYHLTPAQHTWVSDGYSTGWTETYGGTGQTTYTTGDILYADGSNSLTKLGIGSSDQVLKISGGVPTWQTLDGGSIVETAIQNVAGGTGALANVTPSSGNYNTAFGYNAGNAITTGDNNVFIGNNAGLLLTVPTGCVVIGKDALSTATNSSFPVAIGFNAGKSTTSPSSAVYIGYNAGVNKAGSQGCTFVGQDAGNSAGGGFNQTYIGTLAGYYATANSSTFVGYEAGKGTPGSTASSSVGVGYRALYSITTGTYNVCIGSDAGLYHDTSSYCICIGYQASHGVSKTGGIIHQVAIGNTALDSNTGNYSIGIGYRAAYGAITGSNNIAIGAESGGGTGTHSNAISIGYRSAIRNSCVFIGYYTGRTTDSAKTDSVAIGYYAAFNTGTGSVSLGYYAGYTSGDKCISIGYNALRTGSATNTINSICIGESAGYYCQGTGSSYIGYKAGYQTDVSGDYNVAIGYQAMECDTNFNAASNNIALGKSALQKIRDGYDNVAIGQNSLDADTSGYYNIAIGLNSGTAITTGYNNICIGVSAGNAITTGINRIAIGYASNPVSNNQCYIGQPTTNPIDLLAASYNNYSDRRMKRNITSLSNPLNIVMALNPVEFYFDTDKGTESRKKKQLGFIAQDVQEVANNHVYDWGAVSQDEDCWKLDYNQIIAPLVGAVKEQQKQIEAQQLQIENLMAEILKLKE